MKQGKEKRFTFSKVLAVPIVSMYFYGIALGTYITLKDFSQLGVLLSFIGAPVVTVIGFYYWKSKAENMVKMKRENPKETDGVAVDLNNISI